MLKEHESHKRFSSTIWRLWFLHIQQKQNASASSQWRNRTPRCEWTIPCDLHYRCQHWPLLGSIQCATMSLSFWTSMSRDVCLDWGSSIGSSLPVPVQRGLPSLSTASRSAMLLLSVSDAAEHCDLQTIVSSWQRSVIFRNMKLIFDAGQFRRLSSTPFKRLVKRVKICEHITSTRKLNLLKFKMIKLQKWTKMNKTVTNRKERQPSMPETTSHMWTVPRPLFYWHGFRLVNKYLGLKN